MPRKKNSPKGETKKVTTTTTTIVEETIIEKKPGKTYYAFVVDRSGSMDSLKKATIDNFNEQIATLKALQEEYPEEKYYVTLVLFDHEIQTVYKDKPLNEIEKLTEETYVPRGMTSLHDAIGITISELKDRQKKSLKKMENEALIMVLTDGYENNSKEWKGQKVANLIKEVDSNENWTVSFIGASKDSALDAKETLGIQNTTFVDTTSYERYYATNAVSDSLYARGYAKARGASLKTAMFSANVAESGEMSRGIDYNALDQEIAKQTQNKQNDKSEE